MAGVVVRTFVVETPGGPVLVYNSPGIDRAATAIRDLGEPRALLVNHWHEEMYGAPALDVPAHVHAADRSRTEPRLPIAGVFDARHEILPGIEAVPTPGHTRGATAFLWQGPEHRVLFTGDSLWANRDRWEAVVLGESDPTAYVTSLELMASLGADVVAPWVAFDDAPPLLDADPQRVSERIGVVAGRVRAGASA